MSQPAIHTVLRPAPGATLSPGPWGASNDGTIYAVDGKPVCVLGAPFDSLHEQDLTNGAAILALPSMLRALLLLREVRPFNWNDGDDTDLEAAWEAVGDALAMAGHPEPEAE